MDSSAAWNRYHQAAAQHARALHHVTRKPVAGWRRSKMGDYPDTRMEHTRYARDVAWMALTHDQQEDIRGREEFSGFKFHKTTNPNEVDEK